MSTAHMPEAEYRAIPALSYSGMKDLAISPLRFWYNHVRPDREPEPPTPAQIFGTALHCAVLEGSTAYWDRYACELEPPEGCLDTIADLREFYFQHTGKKASGSLKAEVIRQVQQAFPHVPILEVLQRQYAAENANKTILKKADWDRVNNTAKALLDEPRVKALLSEGEPEVAMFATDPDTGVPLKCRMDWVRPDCIVDLKTFAQQRDRSIDKTVAAAVFYEGYYRQAVLYSQIRSLQSEAWKPTGGPEFIFPFVESEEPHETRIKVMRPKAGGNVNLLWERGRIECRELIRTYAECMEQFGVEKPWRWAQEAIQLDDSEVPGLAYA